VRYDTKQDSRDENADSDDTIVGARIHAEAITRFLWGVATTLAGAWIIASLSFAWSVNSNCVEFRQALSDIRADDAHMASELNKLQDRLNDTSSPTELVGLRVDVSQLQYQYTVSIQTLNDLTRQIRELHPWQVSPRNQASSAPAQP
jgi:hypothetical protein